MKRKPTRRRPMTSKQIARLGGLGRAKSLSRQDRIDAARKAVQARWARYYAARTPMAPQTDKTAQTAA